MARIRTFVAVDLSAEVKRSARRVIADLSATPAAVKWVSADHLHVTLKFLGDVDDSQIYQVCAAIRDVAAGQPLFKATCASVGAFPKRESPRTIWLGISDGTEEFRRLQSSLELRLQDLGFSQERRQFTPHVTLGRVDREVSGSGAGLPMLVQRMSQGESLEVGEFPVDRCVLYSSELTPRGPVYRVLGKFPLGACE